MEREIQEASREPALCQQSGIGGPGENWERQGKEELDAGPARGKDFNMYTCSSLSSKIYSTLASWTAVCQKADPPDLAEGQNLSSSMVGRYMLSATLAATATHQPAIPNSDRRKERGK